MLGKELKVMEYNLTFGKSARIVNIYGLFRYKKNNGLYVLYADVDSGYPVVYYGSSHVKNHSILSISTKEEDVEIIKEYIFKVTNGEKLDGFEIISLNEIEGIEIISSNRLEIKPEVMNALIDKTIPKKESSDTVTDKPISSHSIVRLLVIILVLVCLACGGYYFLVLSHGDTASKSIICTKEVSDRNLNARVEESIVSNFNNKNVLENIETTQVFMFDTESDYQDFINKGIMYKYMPDDENGGYKQDDEKLQFSFVTRMAVDSSYLKPTGYEEVLSYYKGEGYTCDEKLIGE